MAWETKEKKKAKARKKILKSIFGKALPLVMALVLLIGFAFWLLYLQCAPVKEFVDNNEFLYSIFSGELFGATTTTQNVVIPPIDPEGDEMAVHFIDVGQGDATLFQTAAGSVLVDCSVPEAGDDILAYLDALGIAELEYFIITHPDEDHMGAASIIIEGVDIKTVVLNGQEKGTRFFEKALDAIEAKNTDSDPNNDIELLIAAPGDVYTVGALQMKVYGPYTLDFSEAKWNNASIILHATYGDRSFLLTGDAEEEGEEDLLEHHASQIKCDVFQAGHHGSRSSNSPELLENAMPEYVVISCGEGNSYGHPHQEALDAFEDIGATVYRTDLVGTIVFVTDGENLEYVQ